MDSVGKEKIPFPSVSMVTGGERQNPDPQFPPEKEVAGCKSSRPPSLSGSDFVVRPFFKKEEGHSDALPVLLPVRYVCQNNHRKEYI
jgi:hypothetical protein